MHDFFRALDIDSENCDNFTFCTNCLGIQEIEKLSDKSSPKQANHLQLNPKILLIAPAETFIISLQIRYPTIRNVST